VFVGTERVREVERLVQDFNRVTALREPALVVLVATPGAGKTRIVQEFYRELATRQPEHPYWLASLVTEVSDAGVGLAELTASRKTVRHRSPVTPPAEAEIPWLWLAPAAGRLSDGSPAPAFDGLVSQFKLHVPALLRRLEANAQLEPGHFTAIKKAVADLAAGQSGERPGELAGLMSRMLPPGPGGARVSAVLVLDDAHDLDEITVEFVRELLAMEAPVLTIATTWPDKLSLAGGRRLPPFSRYVTALGESDRIDLRYLGSLTEDDLVAYVTGQFPATDQKVAATLAWRADYNPYALRLLLNTPRVSGSVRDGAITLSSREIADLSGRLETLLTELWNELPTGVRQILVAAALLGQSFHDEVLEAGLRRYRAQARLDDALASSWIRHLGGSDRILEFAELLRYEIAIGNASDFMSDNERKDVYDAALHTLRWLLQAEPEGIGRVVLLALHVLLAKEGAEDDLAASASSAAELGDRARSEYRRLEGIEYYRQAITWAENSQPVPMRQLVVYLVNCSSVERLQHGRTAAEPTAARAVQLADQYLDPDDEMRIHARCMLVRARRRREEPDVYASAHALFAEARELLERLGSPSPEATRDVRSVEEGLSQSEGEFQQAAELARSMAEFCEEHFGPLHRHTLSALTELGYCLHRSDSPDAAIAVRRTLLDRRIQRFNDAGHLQTVTTKSDLAVSLVCSRDPDNLDEAERLIEEAITRKSRAYGVDARSTQASRSLRTRLWLARGLIAEAVGRQELAGEFFGRAADETVQLLKLRKGADGLSRYAVSLQRHGEALACLRQADAVSAFDDSLRIREDQLAQGAASWEVQDCAKSLWWTYERLIRVSEAEAVVRRYQLTGEPDS
jgi:tetratricopeptide (TPR) repeat protein